MAKTDICLDLGGGVCVLKLFFVYANHSCIVLTVPVFFLCVFYSVYNVCSLLFSSPIPLRFQVVKLELSSRLLTSNLLMHLGSFMICVCWHGS